MAPLARYEISWIWQAQLNIFYLKSLCKIPDCNLRDHPLISKCEKSLTLLATFNANQRSHMNIYHHRHLINKLTDIFT